MRADRLLSILLLLQVHRRITARQLAERLEVSRRTIYRDMDVLSGAGVPVVAERGTGGGWFLLDTYQTKLNGLNHAEIQALFLPQPDQLLADLGLHQASEAALVKLLAALPAMHRPDAEFVRQRVHIDGTGWRPADEDLSFLPTLQEAVWQGRKLQLTYQLSSGPVVEPVLDPLGLVAKGSVWYLVALWESQTCVYRVSRVHDAQVLEEPCVRPDGFDLAAFWKQSSADLIANRPRYPATLRADPAVLPRLRCHGRCTEVEPAGGPDADGWTTLAVEFETLKDASAYVLSFGPQVEILEPPELRERIVELAQNVVDRYAQSAYALLVSQRAPVPA
jgi:predicted DNA-binding transcriptional regulator YafY